MNQQQSILMRPRRTVRSLKNDENVDAEFEREQKKLEAKRNRYNQLHEDRRVSLWGEAEEKKDLQEKRRHEIAHHLDVRKENEKREAMQDLQVVSESKQHEEAIKYVEHEQQYQRRQYLKSLMDDNIRLTEMKRDQERQEREMEKERERNQIEFFDRHRNFR
jgi:hypothetical protein